MESRKIDYDLLKNYISDKNNEYVLEENETSIVLTFLPMADSIKQRLGGSSFMRLYGIKMGNMIELTKLVVVEENDLSEVSIETLDGWLDYVKNVY